MRVVALGAALGGGMCLVANLFVDRDALAWVGLGLVGLAVLVTGWRLVRAPWLAVISSLGSLALAWALLALLRGETSLPDRTLEAAVGGLATLCVAVVLMRRPAAAAQPPARAGNHRH